LLCAADADALAEALLELTRSPELAGRLARAGVAAAAERTWEGALERLAAGYRRLLDVSGPAALSRAA
jgi:hypothetical protein